MKGIVHNKTRTAYTEEKKEKKIVFMSTLTLSFQA